MIPLYDTTRTRIFPLVNLGLIVLNVLVFFVEIGMTPSELRSFIFTWGLIPAHLFDDPSGTWETIFSSMFLHGGWFHIISNMWVLYIFGDNVEARLGKVRYLVFYLMSGVAAALLQAYLWPTSADPMIGASGAIAGVLGAYLILFPGSRIASLVPILFILTIVEVPALIFLIFWFITQVYSGLFMMDGGAASGIAWWAHIGGFLFGVFMVLFFARSRATYRSY
jgi:membrane associated rhomboid family serine protease